MPQAVIDGHQETLEAGAESARRILAADGRLGMGVTMGLRGIHTVIMRRRSHFS